MNKAICVYMTTLMTLGACSSSSDNKTMGRMIEKQEIVVENGVMTPEVLNSFGRLSDVQLSPDGKSILYGVSYVSIPENSSNRELFTMRVDGSDKKQITKSANSESQARWINGGKEIVFISSEGGTRQLWAMNSDGTSRRQISNEEGGVNGFIFSPDEKQVILIKDVKFGERIADKHPDLPKANAQLHSDVMYKHWDEWVESIPHPFIAKFDGERITEAEDILDGQPFECPTKPHGGVEQLSWSPDGKLIAYSCKKKIGLAYSLSTNTDIYIYNLESKRSTNISEGMLGYDTEPKFSPDGTQIAWLSMERDGYESDLKRLFVMNLSEGTKRNVLPKHDYNIDAFQWSSDSKEMALISCKNARTHIWHLELDSSTLRQVTDGDFDYESVAMAKDNWIAVRHSLSQPNEVYSINPNTGEAKELSFENVDILKQINMGRVEERWIETTDNKKMLTWVVYPPDFDPTKSYPAILYCQGGPQNTVSQFFSYRWNLQLMAANGYIVVAPNRRGVPGFGQEWNEQISGDYGGQNMKDYLSAIDAVAAEPFVDSSRLGAVGASYGGFSVYWLAGNHDKRFKAFVSHAGIFNLEAQYLETEELWFANWDMGGAYWDKENSVAQKTYSNSPHRFVDKWDTPILCIHGELDYRILASQGMMAFNAAKLRGLPAELLIYPKENHWIVEPQNSILWQRTFFGWLDKWLKPKN
ncbi:MAG: alpha/beta fold hydrolase [Bacteroidales bacterium]